MLLMTFGLVPVGAGVAAADVPICAGRSATIVGTDADDILAGTDGADVIVGLGGNDGSNRVSVTTWSAAATVVTRSLTPTDSITSTAGQRVTF